METINLPLYTLFIYEVAKTQFFIKIQSIDPLLITIHLYLDPTSDQMFEGFTDLVSHLNVPEHSSVNFALDRLSILTAGKLGKNRKYFQIKRLNLERCDGLTITQIIQQCEKPQCLTERQIKQFIKHLAIISKKKSNQTPQQKKRRSSQQLNNERLQSLQQECQSFYKKTEKRSYEFQEYVRNALSYRNWSEEISEIIEQRVKQVFTESAKQMNKQVDSICVIVGETEANLQFLRKELAKVQQDINEFCVKFKSIQCEDGWYTGALVNDVSRINHMDIKMLRSLIKTISFYLNLIQHQTKYKFCCNKSIKP